MALSPALRAFLRDNPSWAPRWLEQPAFQVEDRAYKLLEWGGREWILWGVNLNWTDDLELFLQPRRPGLLQWRQASNVFLLGYDNEPARKAPGVWKIPAELTYAVTELFRGTILVKGDLHEAWQDALRLHDLSLGLGDLVPDQNHAPLELNQATPWAAKDSAYGFHIYRSTYVLNSFLRINAAGFIPVVAAKDGWVPELQLSSPSFIHASSSWHPTGGSEAILGSWLAEMGCWNPLQQVLLQESFVEETLWGSLEELHSARAARNFDQGEA